MGGGVSKVSQNDSSEIDFQIKQAIQKKDDSSVSFDSVIECLEAQLGASFVQGKKDIIQKRFEVVHYGLIHEKLQPHIREYIRQSKLIKVSKKDMMRRLETVFGPQVHSLKEAVRKIMDEESTKYILEEGKPALGGKYLIGETLGKGNYGVVKKAISAETKEIYAMKLISTEYLQNEKTQQQLRREIDIMKTLLHENVLQLYEVHETNQFVYLVLELVDGGELLEFESPPDKIFSEELARYYFQQIVLGIYYCHRRGVAHRDLKPANLLVTQQKLLKVSDFGLSAYQNQTPSGNVHDSMQLKTCCGSPKYIAPEVINNSGYNGFLADAWSCGVILYLMLCGKAPFDHKTMSGLIKKVVSGNYVMEPCIPSEASDLISKLLVVQPETRLTIQGVIQHPWFQVGFDTSKLDALRDVQPNTVQSTAGSNKKPTPTTNTPVSKSPLPQSSSKSSLAPSLQPLMEVADLTKR